MVYGLRVSNMLKSLERVLCGNNNDRPGQLFTEALAYYRQQGVDAHSRRAPRRGDHCHLLNEKTFVIDDSYVCKIHYGVPGVSCTSSCLQRRWEEQMREGKKGREITYTNGR